MLIKKALLFLTVLLIMNRLQSQVMVNVHLPSSGLTVKSQLWNLSLLNTTGSNLDVQVEMEMVDVVTNQRVLAGSTRRFILSKGIKQLNLGELNPITYNVINPVYGLDANPNGFLPVGMFNICYSVIEWVNDGSERLSENCETIEVEPLSPPMLLFPYDLDEVESFQPFFSWLPPSPYTLFQNLTYDWQLVELLPTQSVTDAIQTNIPLAMVSNTPFTSLQLPSSTPLLDTSKTYVWRVRAKNNSAPVADSEIWTFRIRQFSNDTATSFKTVYYSKLQKDEGASFILCDGVLHFQYTHELNEQIVKLQLINVSKSKQQVIPLPQEAAAMTFGVNNKDIDLRNIEGMKNKEVYILELTTDANEKWYLKFLFNESE